MMSKPNKKEWIEALAGGVIVAGICWAMIWAADREVQLYAESTQAFIAEVSQ